MSNDDYSNEEQRIKVLEIQLSQLREENYFLTSENASLRKEKEKYQLISDFSQDWQFWIDTKGDFIWLSPSCVDITGYSSNEFFLDPNLFLNVVLPEDQKAVKEFLHHSIHFMQIGQSIEFRLLTRTKQLRWCELNSKAVFDKMGSYLGQRGSIRDITRLKSALGQIKEMSEKQVWEMKTNQKYRDQIAGKDRELITSLIEIAKKNEMLKFLQKNLTLIRPTLPVASQKKVNEMIQKIETHQRSQIFNWDDFKFYFEKIHQGFFERLNGTYPILTAKDQRLCAYIHLGLSTKDIAGLINIAPESAEIARIRLRKKLGLSRNHNLSTFLQNI